MNKEQYVTFEIAKLLKEKGFDWQTEFVWYEHLPVSIDWRNKTNQKALDYYYANETTEHNSSYRNCDTKPSYIDGDIYSAPTQQMACRWLREERGIHIYPIPVTGFNYVVSVYVEQGNKTYDRILSRSGRNAYEEATNAALQYCLTNLI